MGKTLLRGLSGLLTAVLVLLTVAAVWALATAKPDRPASLFGFSPMVVVSGSMEPVFPVGTFLLSRKATPAQVEEGDIIVFYGTVGSTTGVITHRVIQKTGTGDDAVLTTKGDANPVADPNPVTRDNLLGKVVWQSPALGKLIAPLRTPAVRPFLFLLPAALILWEVFGLLREHRKSSEEEESNL